MYSFFPLFSSHIDLAHHYWMQVVKKGDTVIDATCGNGKDTLVLARLALEAERGSVIGLDIQKDALEETRNHIAGHLPSDLMPRVHLFHQSHAEFPPSCHKGSIRLIVYNLGYLPGGDKGITTMVSTTLTSVDMALQLLIPGGLLSITCYPGHGEGEKEEQALIAWLKTISHQAYSVCHHQWLNRRTAPSLIIIQKALPRS